MAFSGHHYPGNYPVYHNPSSQLPYPIDDTPAPVYLQPVPTRPVNYRSAPSSLPYPATPPPIPSDNHFRSTSNHFEALPPPPQAPQVFDRSLGSRYQYRYSQCNGNRKALLIGINYFNTSNALQGCINDVRKLAPFLVERYGFSYDDMVILTDDQREPASQPTRANIIRAMHWLVAGAQPNDSLFFHFSGHGGQTEDLDGDEEDGLDETIYPVDFKHNGHIVDDEMHDILVKPLPAGCRLTAIFDCCHSGSALDLPYEYSVDGQVKEPNLVTEAAKGLLNAGVSYARGDVEGIISAGMTLFNKFTKGKEAREKSRRTKSSPADVIQLSGCKDYQKAADTVAAGEASGAMSWAFREVLGKQPKQSYASLLQNIREVLSESYAQKPVLSASHPIDTSIRFVL